VNERDKYKNRLIVVMVLFWGVVALIWGWNWLQDRQDERQTSEPTSITLDSNDTEAYAACYVNRGALSDRPDVPSNTVGACVKHMLRYADTNRHQVRNATSGFQSCSEYALDSDFEIADSEDLAFYLSECFEDEEYEDKRTSLFILSHKPISAAVSSSTPADICHLCTDLYPRGQHQPELLHQSVRILRIPIDARRI
jgi:hypothetical protein